VSQNLTPVTNPYHYIQFIFLYKNRLFLAAISVAILTTAPINRAAGSYKIEKIVMEKKKEDRNDSDK
jgi:hypothetical protein